MDWIDTPESSNMARFAYDKSSETLWIEFKNGGTYQYFEVNANVFDEMKVAPSKGKFFAENVKGVFRFARA